MNLIQFLFGSEQRATKSQENLLWSIRNNTSSGEYVSAETAVKISTVYACTRILSETLGSLPLILYKRLKGGGKERAVEHPLYKTMGMRPNPYQSSMVFRELLQAGLCLRGNAYAQIIRDGGGRVAALIPLPPDQVTPELSVPEGNALPVMAYKFKQANGIERYFKQDQILHVQGLGTDGVQGLSIIDIARESLGIAIAEEKHAGAFFGNGLTPSAILEHPGKMQDKALKNLRESFQNQYAGSGNAHKTIILEAGVKFTPVTLSHEQSQFIESREFQVTDICRWFLVPPHLVFDLRRATFTNIEQQSLEFITFHMRPWLVRWEQAMNHSLLSEKEQDEYFFEFLAEGLLRGDIQSRYNAYNIGRNGGWLSADEIRALENMNPLPNGEGSTYLTPLNMKSNGEPTKDESADEPED